jgi:hypothetical protein
MCDLAFKYSSKIHSGLLEKFQINFPIQVIHDLATKVIETMRLRNKSRMYTLMSESLQKAQEMTQKFKFEEHFHCVVMSALEHYSEMYKVNPSTESKGSYSPMELIIQGALYQN